MKKFLLYYNGYEASIGVKPLYIIFNKINGYFEVNNAGKYQTLILTDEHRDMIKKYEEILNKIKYLLK